MRISMYFPNPAIFAASSLMVAINGAFIMTIGAGAAENLGYKKREKFFKVSGIIFMAIGIAGLILSTIQVY